MKKLCNLLRQLFRFGLVGALCFLIDYALMLLLTEVFGVHYVVSCGISFSVSCVVNYLLSMRFVFTRTGEMSRRKEFLIFFFLSVVGLVLTELLIIVFVQYLLIYYAIAKIAVTVIVMAFNFVSRKLVFEKAKEV